MPKAAKHDTLILAGDVLPKDPEIIFPAEDTPRKANRFILPFGYLSSYHAMSKEASSRGDSAAAILRFLAKLGVWENGTGKKTLANGTIVEVVKSNKKQSTTEQVFSKQVMNALGGTSSFAVYTGSDFIHAEANSRGINVARFDSTPYFGRRNLALTEDQTSLWFSRSTKGLPITELTHLDPAPRPNEFFVFSYAGAYENAETDYSYGNIGYYSIKNEAIVPLKYVRKLAGQWKIYPKTAGQAMLFEAMMSPPEEIPLVAVIGTFGTGKTFGVNTCALAQTGFRNNTNPLYERIVIVPSEHSLGRPIGFLPGDLSQKATPMARGIKDNIHNLLKHIGKSSPSDNGKKTKDNTEQSMKNHVGQVLESFYEFEIINFILGASITDSVLYFDEFQDTERYQVRSLLTRLAEGSKTVISGDINQFSNRHNSAADNGLTYGTRLIAGLPEAMVVSFTDKEIIRHPALQSIARRIAEES